MDRIDTLKQLQTRLRNSSGADRALDEDIFAALFPEKEVRLAGMPDYAIGIRMFKYGHETATALCVTASLDACVGLMREKLPGKPWSKTASGRYRIWEDDESLRLQANPFRLLADPDPLATDCLTFCDAIFSALIAQLEAITETVD